MQHRENTCVFNSETGAPVFRPTVHTNPVPDPKPGSTGLEPAQLARPKAHHKTFVEDG